MPAPITIWTPESVAVLRRHAYGRSTPAEIAAMLGISEKAVRTKAAKIGVRFSAKIEAVVRTRIVDLHSQGWRPSRISRQLGIDVALVEANLPPAVSPAPAEPLESRP